MNFMKFHKAMWIGFSSLAILYVFLNQFSHLNPFVSSWDQVDFVLALDRYDLRAMQPHFPGYPYFILAGLLMNKWLQDPGQALVAVNVLAYASSLVPVYMLASRVVSKESAYLVSALLYTASYPLIIVNQPMSEGAALAGFWWFFWSIVAAESKSSGKWLLLPLFLFSVLLGIRLSYLPMGIGIVYLLYKKWKAQELPLQSVIKFVVIAVLFQLIWVGGLILTEGSIVSFLELAFGFTGGHFQEWGGTSASNDLSFLTRMKAFVLTNILWWGIFSQTTILMVLYIVMGSMIFLPARKSGVWKETTVQLSLLLLLAYGGWAFFAQNIDKPRHILPLALLIVFLGSLFFLRKRAGKSPRYLAIGLIIAQAIVSTSYVQKQAESFPAVYQLANYLQEQPDGFVVYTWEETRVMQFLGMTYPHKRVYTYEVFLHDQQVYEGKTIYVTNSVLEGFRAQGVDLGGRLEAVKTFSSNEIFDPVYHEIVLYKWTP